MRAGKVRSELWGAGISTLRSRGCGDGRCVRRTRRASRAGDGEEGGTVWLLRRGGEGEMYIFFCIEKRKVSVGPGLAKARYSIRETTTRPTRIQPHRLRQTAISGRSRTKPRGPPVTTTCVSRSLPSLCPPSSPPSQPRRELAFVDSARRASVPSPRR
jgi:hypothetical protein